MFVIKECGDELFIATASEAIISKAIALDDGVAFHLYEIRDGVETGELSRSKIKELLDASPPLITGDANAMSAIYLYVYST